MSEVPLYLLQALVQPKLSTLASLSLRLKDLLGPVTRVKKKKKKISTPNLEPGTFHEPLTLDCTRSNLWKV